MVYDICILIYLVINCQLYERFRILVWRYSYKMKGINFFCHYDKPSIGLNNVVNNVLSDAKKKKVKAVVVNMSLVLSLDHLIH